MYPVAFYLFRNARSELVARYGCDWPTEHEYAIWLASFGDRVAKVTNLLDVFAFALL
jgi:hypothetical protein